MAGDSEKKRGGRGFAGMDEEKQREIARKGGHAAHEKGTAHEFDSAEAREAGRKGGEAVSRNREHMAEIGARGGHASHGRTGEREQRRSQRPSTEDQGQGGRGEGDR